MPRKQKKGAVAGKIRIIPLGGLGEIGKNMTVIEYNNDMVVIDCGLGFPEDDMPGIDLVIQDISYLEANKDRLRAILLTHGHEDHIGAIPYLLRTVNVPVYGTPLTLGIIRYKLEEHVLPKKPDLRVVNAGDTVKLGSITAEFIHVNHSIADACAIALHTPLGTILHTGDFKLDTTPIDGEMMDIVRLGELGRRGVLMLMCESTNAERPGHTPSEKTVGTSLASVFATHPKKRVIIATFSSNVHRVQQIIDASAKHKRKVAITGRSMLNIVSAATELGYMKIPAGVLIDINDIKRFKPGEVTIVTTGSQGEPMSALYRMAFSDHAQVSLDQNDVVVLSASAIPGNEKLVGRIINELSKNNVEVLHEAGAELHVSGHACQEEHKILHTLLNPKFFIPVHGEYRHLKRHVQLAVSLGMKEHYTLIPEIGNCVELTKDEMKFGENIPAGTRLIDGEGVEDYGTSALMKERLKMSSEGVFVVSVAVTGDYLINDPVIQARGCVFANNETEEEMKSLIRKALKNYDYGNANKEDLSGYIHKYLKNYFYKTTKQAPLIIVTILDV